ncbi:hypothetical protein U5A82_16450 [Sphingobium sp. CR2-8]|uniref:hypothetical protein n=1 Tax=Sphingobium sp. CR2-8 TaxID=1306534 RepID=UPI002DBDF1FE|nr:hypothetical protein [Sphingobium sp. CR2-8]MEC3912006.1 hypothetical protein [Sphingobium sp. CR2-8]
MAQILTALYLFAMLAAGWRLFAVDWTRGMKAAAAVALVCPVPLLLLMSGLLHPDRALADLMRASGLVLLLCGTLSMGGGLSAAWLRARRA